MARRIKVSIHNGYIGGTIHAYHPLPDDWDDMTDDEQQDELDAIWEVEVQNRITGSAEVVEE